MIVLLLAALLGIAGAMVVIYPLLGLERDTAGQLEAGSGDLAEREQAAKGALREVEFDYRLGNLEPADYQDLCERYEARALAALQARTARERTLDALIDRQLAAVHLDRNHDGDRVDEASVGATGARAARAGAKRTPTRRRRGGGSRG